MIPPGLAWVAGLLGGAEWPNGDEDSLFALRDVWRKGGNDLRAVVPALAAAIGAVETAYPQGAGGESITAELDKMLRGEYSLDTLAQGLDQLAAFADEGGAGIEHTKLQILTTLAITAGFLLQALLTPDGEAELPVILAIARMTTAELGSELTMDLIAAVAKNVVLAFVKNYWKKIVLDAVIGTSQELGIDLWQLHEGHIDHINWGQVALNGGTWAAGSLMANAGGDVLGGVFHNGELLREWVPDPNVAQLAAKGMTIGGSSLAAFAGGYLVGGAATGNWQVSPLMFTSMALNVGLHQGLANLFHGRPPEIDPTASNPGAAAVAEPPPDGANGDPRALFRQLVFLSHPDLVPPGPERAVRNAFMIRVNDAYARGDASALEALRQEWLARPTPETAAATPPEPIPAEPIPAESPTPANAGTPTPPTTTTETPSSDQTSGAQATSELPLTPEVNAMPGAAAAPPEPAPPTTATTTHTDQPHEPSNDPTTVTTPPNQPPQPTHDTTTTVTTAPDQPAEPNHDTSTSTTVTSPPDQPAEPHHDTTTVTTTPDQPAEPHHDTTTVTTSPEQPAELPAVAATGNGSGNGEGAANQPLAESVPQPPAAPTATGGEPVNEGRVIDPKGVLQDTSHSGSRQGELAAARGAPRQAGQAVRDARATGPNPNAPKETRAGAASAEPGRHDSPAVGRSLSESKASTAPQPQQSDLLLGSDPPHQPEQVPPAANAPAAHPAPPIDDAWAHRDIPQIAAALGAEHGVAVVGFDHPGMDVEVAREFARAVDDVLTKYPRIELRSIRVEALGDGRFAKTTRSPGSADNVTEAVTLNELLATDPVRLQQSVALNVEAGRFSPSFGDRPVYSVIVHELGHALDYAGSRQTRIDIQPELLREYLATHTGGTPEQQYEGFQSWLRDQLSGYSFHKDGSLNEGEALAEGFAAVELQGENASRAAHILHNALVRAAENRAAPNTATPTPAEAPRDEPPNYLGSDVPAGAGNDGPMWLQPVHDEVFSSSEQAAALRDRLAQLFGADPEFRRFVDFVEYWAEYGANRQIDAVLLRGLLDSNVPAHRAYLAALHFDGDGAPIERALLDAFHRNGRLSVGDLAAAIDRTGGNWDVLDLLNGHLPGLGAELVGGVPVADAAAADILADPQMVAKLAATFRALGGSEDLSLFADPAYHDRAAALRQALEYVQSRSDLSTPTVYRGETKIGSFTEVRDWYRAQIGQRVAVPPVSASERIDGTYQSMTPHIAARVPVLMEIEGAKTLPLWPFVDDAITHQAERIVASSQLLVTGVDEVTLPLRIGGSTIDTPVIRVRYRELGAAFDLRDEPGPPPPAPGPEHPPSAGGPVVVTAETGGIAEPQASGGYPSPTDVSHSEFDARVAGLDASSVDTVVAALYRPHPRDQVTGFYGGYLRVDEVTRALQTGQRGFVVSVEVANLGGLNQLVENRAEAANPHYRALAQIVARELTGAGAVVVPIRLDGTHVGAVVLGTDEAAMAAARAAIEQHAADYSRQHGLSEVPHPKQPDKPEYRGVWLNAGYTEIRAESNPKNLWVEAEKIAGRSEQRRLESYVAGQQGRAAGPDRPVAGATQTADRGDGTRTGAEVGRSQGSPPEPVVGHETGLTPYPSPDEVRLAEFRATAATVDYTSPIAVEQAFYEYFQPIHDEVTGFYDARLGSMKSGEVSRAQQFVADTGTSAYYVSADLANLGGLNLTMPDREHADAHYSAIAGIFRRVLEESGGTVVPMRTGGDEMGVVVMDVNAAAMAAARARIALEVADYASRHGLSDIPHPKHPSDPAYSGVGLHVGYVDIVPGVDVKDIFDYADLRLNDSKLHARGHIPTTEDYLTGRMADPTDDMWAHLDNVPEIVRALENRHDVLFIGFDRPGVDIFFAREFARAVDDTLTKYPQIQLPSVSIKDDMRHWTFGRAPYSRERDGTTFTDWIHFNQRDATDLPEFLHKIQLMVESGKYLPIYLDRPVYSLVVHELGHALDDAGSLDTSQDIERILLQHYINTHQQPSLAGFRSWLRGELSGYSFANRYQLNPAETIAEGFTAVELLGENASAAAELIHRTVVEAALQSEQDGIRAAHLLDPTPPQAPRLEHPVPPIDDAWSERDIAQIVNALRANGVEMPWFGYVDVDQTLEAMRAEGAELPSYQPFDVDIDLVREFSRAVSGILVRHPNIDPSVISNSSRLNDAVLAGPIPAEWRVTRGVRQGRFPPTYLDRSAYSVFLLELGHELDAAGSFSAAQQIGDDLHTHYQATHPDAGPADYRAWLRSQLSGHSFDKQSRLNSVEAVMEGFAAVEIQGERATDAAKLIHTRLVHAAQHPAAEPPDSRPPDTPPDMPFTLNTDAP